MYVSIFAAREPKSPPPPPAASRKRKRTAYGEELDAAIAASAADRVKELERENKVRLGCYVNYRLYLICLILCSNLVTLRIIKIASNAAPPRGEDVQGMLGRRRGRALRSLRAPFHMLQVRVNELISYQYQMLLAYDQY